MFFQEVLTASVPVQNQSEMEALDKLDQETETYMRNSKSHIKVLHAEAKKKAKKEKKKVEMVAKDPLDFWFAGLHRCLRQSYLRCSKLESWLM